MKEEDYDSVKRIVEAMNKVPNVTINPENGAVLGRTGTSITGKPMFNERGQQIEANGTGKVLTVGRKSNEDEYMAELIKKIKKGK